jgi:hypothetical protein
VDIRADLYSLGCALYRLLTGRAPFAGPAHDTLTKKVRAHAEEGVAALRTSRPDVPAELAAVVDRLLAKAPEMRFAVPLDVVQALEPFTAGCDLRGLVERARQQIARGEPQAGIVPAHALLRERPAHAPNAAGQVGTPAGPTRGWPVKRKWPPFVRRGSLLALGLAVPVVAAIALWPGDQEQPRPEPKLVRQQPGPQPKVVPVAVSWPEDYPQALRERAWDKPITILGLRPDLPEVLDLSKARNSRNLPAGTSLYLPLWCRRLVGISPYYPSPDDLQLRTNPKGVVTVLALDDDLERRWFEFTAEVRRDSGESAKGARGLFFGWRQEGEGKARAYFVHLDLQSGKGSPPGTLVVGPAILDTRPEAAAQSVVAPLPAFDGKPPRSLALTRKDDPYRVRIRALPRSIRVQVDGEEAIEFEPPFDPRGPLGIWVQRGSGWFMTATITALRAE